MSGSDSQYSLFFKSSTGLVTRRWVSLMEAPEELVSPRGKLQGRLTGGSWGVWVCLSCFQVVPASEKWLRNPASLVHMSICENEDKRTRKSKLRVLLKGSDPHPVLFKEQTQQNRWVGLGFYPGSRLFFISCALCVDRTGCHRTK